MVGSISVAVVAAAGSAVSFALTGMLQHHVTGRVRRRRALDPVLLYDLGHQPLWLMSIAAAIVGFTLQGIALRFGPLTLVQPILATQVLAAPLLAVIIYQRRLDGGVLLGAVLSVVGLSAFLVAGDPHTVPEARPAHPVLFPLAVAILVVALSLLVVSRRRSAHHALVLALGAGVLYGVTAGLLEPTVENLGHGWSGLLTTWTLYPLLLTGPLGFLLNQNAFQQGSLVGPLTVITITDPLVAIGIGLLWLGERVNISPWAITTEVIGFAVMAVGIAVLARLSPRSAGEGAVVADSGAGLAEPVAATPRGCEVGSLPASPPGIRMARGRNDSPSRMSRRPGPRQFSSIGCSSESESAYGAVHGNSSERR